MMTIPTFVALSQIHGMGLFTYVDIHKGDTVWIFDDLVDQKFTEYEFLEMCEYCSYENYKKFHAWAYFEKDVWILCGDNAKFFNHSDTPNIKETNGVMYSVAERDIKRGEELTCNYKDFDEHDKLVKGNLYDQSTKKSHSSDRTPQDTGGTSKDTSPVVNGLDKPTSG